MAEQLDDGEFWLPSQFLTDDDILMDFSPPLSKFHSSFGFGSSSDLGSLTESSDDDDLLLRTCLIHSKGGMLSTSPQSTLCGCMCNNQGSSRGSTSGPLSPPKEKADEKEKGNATLDLLNKAAGEVAKMKLRNESKSTGTGFFDCSNSAKGLLCPPRPPTQQSQTPQPLRSPSYFPPFYSHTPPFHRFPPKVMWTPPPFQQPLQNRVATKNNCNGKVNNVVNNTRPLGLPPSAWPPLPGQVQVQAQVQPQPQPQGQSQAQPIFVGPKRDSVGTGVFLPRRVNSLSSDSRKKSDGNVTKTTKNSKGSQRRNNKCQSTVKDDEIQLPSEWIY